uniref:NEDD8 activating enzyme E1 subunit 1 n=1 Tax=Spermophilus dauricus TaxID=99837 RepID=A0A8C9Q6J0_SPEDA
MYLDPLSPLGEMSREQIRLWGDHGQEALESAHVCLIHATATGTEILKNLVLPGIGSFTIVDGNQVSGEDAGNKTELKLPWNSYKN